MIPVADNVPARQFPLGNWLLLASIVLVFLLELAQGQALEAFLQRWALIPAALTGAVAPAPDAAPPLITLFSAMFLHAGFAHLIGNALFLYIFGDNVEDAMGTARYLVFYLVCGLVASFAQIALDPAGTIPNVGASGAISGVLGAYIVMYPRATVTVVLPLLVLFPVMHVPALVMLGLWFFTQFTNGLAALAVTEATGGVAWWAHIGGFIAGVLLVSIFRRRRRVRYEDDDG